MAAILFLFPMTDADAKATPGLQIKSKVMKVGQTYDLTLKNVSKKTGIQWKSSKKSVVAIQKKKGCTVLLKAKKCGTAVITATYKKKDYKCRISVKSGTSKSDKEKPVMNETKVDLYYLSDEDKDKIAYDKTHLREFRFRVTGTKQEVVKWELVGEDKDFFKITDYGKVTLFWGVDYVDFVKSATVRATLEDGTVLTATVFEYNEVNLYINKLFDEFIQTYITDDMTELEKAEKAAWYIGAISDYEAYDSDWMHIFIEGKGDCMASRWALGSLCRYMGVKAWECSSINYHGKTLVKADGEFYMFVTGYDEPRPRSYSVWKVPEDQLDKIAEDNGIWMWYFED